MTITLHDRYVIMTITLQGRSVITTINLHGRSVITTITLHVAGRSPDEHGPAEARCAGRRQGDADAAGTVTETRPTTWVWRSLQQSHD